jgi:hypothetical protein
MADSLQDLYNSPTGMFSKVTDPFTIKDLANQYAQEIYGSSGSVGGKADALRHILGAAMLAKRQGQSYADTITGLHENPYLPFIGGIGQHPADKAMDEYNNRLGMELGSSALDYNDLVTKARQYVDIGKAKQVGKRESLPTQPSRDYVDEAINGGVDLIRRMFTK